MVLGDNTRTKNRKRGGGEEARNIRGAGERERAGGRPQGCSFIAPRYI